MSSSPQSMTMTDRTGAKFGDLADDKRRGIWRRLRSTNGLIFLLCTGLIVLGWQLPLQRYLTPRSGAGYVLGIVGGSLMLLLLIYPARKRYRRLAFLGSVKVWFRLHMLMGLFGPICILYHADFSLGAINSNMALISMLIVSGSGIVGRYFYTQIHEGLSEQVTSLEALQVNADRLRRTTWSVPLFSQLLQQLLDEERSLLAKVADKFILLRPFYAAGLAFAARRRLSAQARRILREAAVSSAVIAAQRLRLLAAVKHHIRERLDATRRVGVYQAYTRLFSLWHVLHLPLFFMLLLAGTVHVIAVHVY